MAALPLASLIDTLDASCRDALENAASACVNRGGYEIGIEDYVRALLPLQGFQDVLTQFGRDAGRVQALLDKSRAPSGHNTGRPAFSPLLVQFLQEAYLLASLELGRTDITVGVLVLALLRAPARYGLMPFFRELKEIPADELKRLLEGQSPQNGHGAGPGGAGEGALQRFTVDFTEEAKQGKTDPVFGRGTEIRLMADILTRRRKNNPILVGDPGVGKTAIVEGLALKIVNEDVPDALKGARVVGLDMGRLQAGAGVKGEFEKRLKSVIDEVKASSVPTILFIDEAHTLVGSGNAAGSGDGANLLKPALARGEMRTIAATTWSEYKKYFEKDAALARRFQPVSLAEPSPEETVTILRGITPYYEKTHKVYVRDDAVVRTAELAARHISGRQLPDKAIDVLDTACARVRVSLGAKPAALERLEEELASLRRECEALERDRNNHALAGSAGEGAARHAALRGGIAEREEERAVLHERWEQERSLVERLLAARAAEGGENCEELLASLREIRQGGPLVHYEVNPDLVTEIVSEWTGIPMDKLNASGGALLASLGERLRKRILGQNQALEIIEKAIAASGAGLDNPQRPTGIFLLVGPSGVGKTESALAVADELFGGERNCVSINMSEFQEKHTVSRLIGSPPGYVGYGEGGRLTEAVRRQPYSVVLFDEVEKAHPDILNLFYQVFDKGILADGEGREVDFRNSMIFMTSNLGGDIVSSLCEEDENPTAEAMEKALRPLLTQFFRPALLGRMSVVPYAAISQAVLRRLVVMKLEQVGERMSRQHRAALVWDEEVVDAVARSCTAVDTGARNIDHVISANLLPTLASFLLGSLGDRANATRRLRVSLDGGGFRIAPEPEHKAEL